MNVWAGTFLLNARGGGEDAGPSLPLLLVPHILQELVQKIRIFSTVLLGTPDLQSVYLV